MGVGGLPPPLTKGEAEMATENLTKKVPGTGGSDGLVIIATDTTKAANANLKAQGWETTATTANQPSSEYPV